MEVWTIWLIAAAVLLIVEVMTQMMWALCLTIGALCALAANLAGAGLPVQFAALMVASIVAYVALLPVFKRWHAKKSEKIARTGMDALLGRRAVVTHAIKPEHLGRARIDGDNWQVRTSGHRDEIPSGTEVVVTAYDSIILTVEPIDNNNK
ncbi:MAG: NfeD family protein [Bacteroides sp.]|nr:NfeD family protein [Bacteroides sp.]